MKYYLTILQLYYPWIIHLAAVCTWWGGWGVVGHSIWSNMFSNIYSILRLNVSDQARLCLPAFWSPETQWGWSCVCALQRNKQQNKINKIKLFLLLQTSDVQKQQREGYGVLNQKPFIVPDWITTESFAFHRAKHLKGKCFVWKTSIHIEPFIS